MGKGDRRTTNKRKPRSPVSPTYREPSGRAQRGPKDETEREIRSTAVLARMLGYGLTEEQANQPPAASWIGRMYLRGKISWRAYEAIRLYAIVLHGMSRVCGTPRIKSGTVVDGHGGFDGSAGDDPEYVAWVERTRARFREFRSVLLACPDNLAAMMVEGAARDEELADWLDTIRQGGQALADHLGLPKDDDEKAA